MSNFVFQENGIQHRSKRIPEAEWNAHKDVIIQEYRAGGLSRMRSQMEERHGFFATSKQYEYQLYNKWRVSKHKLGSQVPHEIIGPLRGTLIEQEAEPTSISGDGHILFPETREKVPINRYLPMVKVPSSDNFLQDIPLQPRPVGRKRPIPLEPSPMEDPQKEIMRPDANFSDSALPSKRLRSSNVPKAYTGKGPQPRSGDHKQPKGQIRDLFSVAEVTQSMEDDTSDPTKSLPSLSTRLIDVTLPVELYSYTDVQFIKRAADAFFCLSALEEAFQLYMIVLKRLHHLHVSDSQAEAALIACVRSAKTDTHLVVIRSYLEKLLQDLESAAKAPDPVNTLDYQKMVLHMLLAETCFRQHNQDAGSRHMESANVIFVVIEVSGQMCHNMPVYLIWEKIFFQRLDDDWKIKNIRFKDENDKNKRLFISQLEQSEQWITIASRILSIADWIVVQLLGKPSPPTEWVFFAKEAGLMITRLTHLFVTLWSKWNQSINPETGVLGTELDPMHPDVAGVSDVEIIAVICSLIAGDLGNQFLSSSSEFLDSADTIDYTLKGNHLLALKSLNLFQGDNGLVRAVVDKLVHQSNLYFPLAPFPRDSEASRRLLSVMEEVLMVRLTNFHIGKQETVQDINAENQIPQEQKPQAVIRLSIENPPLAPSLNSSTLSSMRRLAARIRKAKANEISDLSIRSRLSTISKYSSLFLLDNLSEQMSLVTLSDVGEAREITTGRSVY